MYNANGELAHQNLELHKHELIRQAKMERLARQAKGQPSTPRNGWLRSTANFLTAALMKIKPPSIAGLKNGSILITPQESGLETV